MTIVFDENGESEYKELIQSALSRAAESLGVYPKTELELNFLDSNQMRQLNRDARGIDAVTDVLSFPYLDGIKGKQFTAADFPHDVNLETGNLMLGEIDICLPIVFLQAQEYGHSRQRECAYLALHGFLHLLGYDHMTDADKAEMRALEEQILPVNE